MKKQSLADTQSTVTRNIDTIIKTEQDALERRSTGEAILDAAGGFVGTVAFVVVQVLCCVVWIGLNSGKVGVAAFDPYPFPLLALVTSFEAVLMAAFVLAKQNRISAIAIRRDHLDLQVNLRTESQATQIIQMLDRLSARFGVDHDHDAIGRELGRRVEIEHLLEELHRRLPDVPGV